jgi:hypothetical protein
MKKEARGGKESLSVSFELERMKPIADLRVIGKAEGRKSPEILSCVWGRGSFGSRECKSAAPTDSEAVAAWAKG